MYGQNKQFEGVTLALGNCDWHFSLFSQGLHTKQSIDQSRKNDLCDACVTVVRSRVYIFLCVFDGINLLALTRVCCRSV